MSSSSKGTSTSFLIGHKEGLSHRKAKAKIRFIDTKGFPIVGAKVKVQQIKHAFLFGCSAADLAFPEALLDENLYQDRFKALFNLAVIPTYWRAYEPEEDNTRLSINRTVMDWCTSNEIQMKGHPLVWAHTASIPQWVFRIPPNEQEQRLLEFIQQTLFDHPDILLWDLVNEPVHTLPWMNSAKDSSLELGARYQQVELENWHETISSSYHVAKQSSPNAQFILNETLIVHSSRSRRRLVELVKGLSSKGINISAIGVQLHDPALFAFRPGEIHNALDELWEELALPIHISEVIVQASGEPIKGALTGDWNQEKQSRYIAQIYDACFRHPAVQSISYWALSDRNSWRPNGGLLDSIYVPKPAYQALDSLINHAWKTQLDRHSNTQGEIEFRGFKGDYVLHLENGKRYKAIPFNLNTMSTWYCQTETGGNSVSCVNHH